MPVGPMHGRCLYQLLADVTLLLLLLLSFFFGGGVIASTLQKAMLAKRVTASCCLAGERV